MGTVAEWLRSHPGLLDRVVFDVFTTGDLAAYSDLAMESEPVDPRL